MDNESQEYIKKAILSTKDNNKMHFDLALAYEKAGDIKNAIKTFEKAIEYNPNDKESKLHLAELYSANGNPRKAVVNIRSVYLENKEDSRICFLYVILLAKNKNHTEAINKLQQSYKLDSTNHMAQFVRAECLTELNKPREALMILANFERQFENDLNFLTVKLGCYLKMLETETNEYFISLAKNICDKIITQYPEETWAKEKLEKLNNKEEEEECQS